jgi:N-methylhydantoinase A/oxoprolinase/acetone carboxylase beta subunit
VVGSFRNALQSLQIAAPFFISQNDGTLMSADYVEQYPVLTFASGPTNSMRGAALLSGLGDAIVADIGGTTTDVGVLTQRFPRESAVAVDIGGVRTNFRMPDILSVGLGGGSVVRRNGSRVTVGPDSVGYELTQRALVFGGDEVTATDIAVAAGHARIGDPGRVSHLEAGFVESAVLEIHRHVEDAIDRMKTSSQPVPVVLVGGGGILIKRSLRGTTNVVVPELSGVANAMGAAMAQVSGESDRLFSYEAIGRDKALADAKAEATSKAVAAGAKAGTLSIVDVEEVPIAYMPGGTVRVRVKVIGDLNLSERG